MRFSKEIATEYEGDKMSNGKQTKLGKVESLNLELRRVIVEESIQRKAFTCMLMNVDFVNKDGNCICF